MPTRSQTNVTRGRLRWLSSRSMLLLMIATVTLTGAIGYRYYNEPQLTIGTSAPQTIYATQTVLVEDSIATELARKDARQSTALNVFTLNAALTQNIETDFTDLLTQVRSLRRLAGPLPFLATQTVSIEGQSYLRQMEQTQLKALIRSIETGERSSNAIDTHLANPTGQKVYADLNRLYRRPGQAQEWKAVQRALTRANEQYHLARRSIADPLTRIQAEDLLNIPDQNWSALPKKLQIVLRRMLSQGVAPGLAPNITQHAVATQASDWSAQERQAATQLLPLVIRPNLVVDPTETIRQQEHAARSIEPILVQVRAGEIIVQKNQPITSASFALLDHLGLSRRMPNLSGLLSTLFGVLAAIGILTWVRQRHYQQWFHQRWSHRDDILVLVLALTIPMTASLTDAVYPPLPAVGILIGSFYGSVMGAVVTVLMGLVTPLGLPLQGRAFTVMALGSLVGSIMAGKARSREELARVGLVVGAVQTILYILVLGSTSNRSIDFFNLGGTALRQGFIGVGWSVVALGMSPYLEKLFDLITPIRLAELANPNRPLLKQLAESAPGTFQHTQFVTTLAEAGARALNCNVELVRTGTLYHDIGKMHDPQAFIENQFGGPNKHVLLNDPWQSAYLIRLHVSEGLVMARRAGLPSAVQAFIPEHQGTMMISYFYQQAWELARQSPTPLTVREQDFRYDGPRPQSRETGIVMLADSCEAALRAMKHTNPEDALRTVNQIFKARWKEEQLVDTRLSREDLDCLARTFVQVWQQANHERIPYPQAIVSSLRAPACVRRQL
jgi:cyclic-di-AMP phosphodiesterase PgpH